MLSLKYQYKCMPLTRTFQLDKKTLTFTILNMLVFIVNFNSNVVNNRYGAFLHHTCYAVLRPTKKTAEFLLVLETH